MSFNPRVLTRSFSALPRSNPIFFSCSGVAPGQENPLQALPAKLATEDPVRVTAVAAPLLISSDLIAS
ncbi:hypothetical protein D3C71_894220 [compost metagenome]